MPTESLQLFSVHLIFAKFMFYFYSVQLLSIVFMENGRIQQPYPADKIFKTVLGEEQV